MSTTHFAQHLFYYQMKTAMNTVKHTREKDECEKDENPNFMDDAVKFLMCSYWPDSLREAERETVLQTHMSFINYNIYRIYSRNVILYLTSPTSDGGTA